jgi:hypothetical protein
MHSVIATPTVTVRRYSPQDVAMRRAQRDGLIVQVDEGGQPVGRFTTGARRWSPNSQVVRYELLSR